jgi:hypothetical protein
LRSRSQAANPLKSKQFSTRSFGTPPLRAIPTPHRIKSISSVELGIRVDAHGAAELECPAMPTPVEIEAPWVGVDLDGDGVPRTGGKHLVDSDGKALGRPVGVVIDKTGALLVADDVGNTVWRVTAAGARSASAGGIGAAK